MIKIKASLEDSRVSSKLLLMLCTTCFFTLFGIFAWQLVTGGDASTTNSLKVLQFFQSVGMFVIPPFVMAYFWSEKPLLLLQLTKKSSWSNYFIVVLAMIIFIPFLNLLVEINHQLVLPSWISWLETEMKLAETQNQLLSERFLSGSGFQLLLFNILLIAVLPAVGEELFFRGSVFSILQQWRGAIIAIWVSAIFFSAIHFQFYGFIPRMLLGAFFGYLLVWSGNMWLPILAHFTNNLMAVVFYYLKNNGYQVLNIDTIGTGQTLWVGCLSAVLSVMAVFAIRRKFSILARPRTEPI